MPLPSVFQGVQDCRLPGLKPSKPFPAGLQGNNSYSYMPLPSVFQGVQDCRLPGLKPPKPSRRPFSGGSRLPFARPQTLQTLPQASKATTLTATCPCHLFFRGFKTAVCPASNPPNPSAGLQGNNSYSYMPLPSVFQGVQDCRLPGLKPPKPSRRPFSGGSRLPFARPQTLQTLPQASKATTLTATCPCHLFFRGFKTAVCPASNPPNPSAGLQGNNSYSYMPLPSVFQGVQGCRLPGLKPPKPFRRPPRQQLLHLPSVFQGVQDCRLPGLKPPKPFRRPPRQQLLQLHAPAICFSGGSRLPFARPQTLQTLPQASKATTLTPAICFSGGSRLPFARPQTLQTLPQASKATTLTATGPCHLFFRGFKTAVCPASNPPNPSAGLQGNSYMPLPSISFVLFFLWTQERWLIKRDDYHWMGNIKLSPILLRRTINWQGWRGCRVQGSLNLEPAESKGTKFRAKIWDVTGLDIDQPPSAQPPRRGVGGTRALAHSIIVLPTPQFSVWYQWYPECQTHPCLPRSVSLPEIVQVSNVFIFSKVAEGKNYHEKSMGFQDSNIPKYMSNIQVWEVQETQAW